MSCFFVFLGGGFGSVLRFLISHRLLQSCSVFPWGTLVVNLLGSLLFGVFLNKILPNSSHTLWRDALLVGFCGGLTTFSSFAYEIYYLYSKTLITELITYVLLTLILGISLMIVGYKVT